MWWIIWSLIVLFITSKWADREIILNPPKYPTLIHILYFAIGFIVLIAGLIVGILIKFSYGV